MNMLADIVFAVFLVCSVGLLIISCSEKTQQKPCDICKPINEDIERPMFFGAYITISLGQSRGKWVIRARWHGCPPYAECCAKEMNITQEFEVNVCPKCGRKLPKE